jgi:flagellar motility protein MotE (MotC chaperone)
MTRDFKVERRSRSRLLTWLKIVGGVIATGVFGLAMYELLYSVNLETSLFGQAGAEEKTAHSGPKKEEKSSNHKSENKTKDEQHKVVSSKSWSDEEISLFKKLEERKAQLDVRESELLKLEEELQRQRGEIEKRLTLLEGVRDKIATKLEDKVKMDQQKVDSLVLVYSAMKPAQAAKIIEGINEDLAVEVLTKMKNKNAAEVLDLMDSEKAKKLSERYTGFRAPAGK